MLIVSTGHTKEVYSKLRSLKNVSVYWKEEIPNDFHYQNNRRIAPIILVANKGVLLCDNKTCDEVKGNCIESTTVYYVNNMIYVLPVKLMFFIFCSFIFCDDCNMRYVTGHFVVFQMHKHMTAYLPHKFTQFVCPVPGIIFLCKFPFWTSYVPINVVTFWSFCNLQYFHPCLSLPCIIHY